MDCTLGVRATFTATTGDEVSSVESKLSDMIDLIAAITLVSVAIIGGLSLVILWIAGLFTSFWVTAPATVIIGGLLGYWAVLRLNQKGILREWFENV